MSKLNTRSAIAIVVGFAGLFLGVQLASDAWLKRPNFERIRPDDAGEVRIDVSGLDRLQVQFYRFLNAGNQEVQFLVGRDSEGVVQVGFNANPQHYKTRRGFSYQDGWIVDNKCETTTRLSAINKGGRGCKPAALKHRVVGDELVLREADILEGWRYFR
ncbi:MAG: DUF2318 domain-containing protein [bacterium]|nr:DUF2318 domain-containing protein [bacterium]